ncbi:MAG: sigma-70 family RNA polymerase sigma factor [Proteobacteria bacterium]|nr:sigma-70 family RNA polymerase sigma factor [Pseudomonadota bacterium]
MAHPRERPETIAAINRRDPAVLEQVARDHLPALLRAARAAGLGDDDAYDAVQDALLVFVQRAADFDGRAPVVSWLLGILYRKVQERRRSRGREEAASENNDGFGERFDREGMWIRPPRTPEEYTAGTQAMAWLTECMEGLNDRRRVAFVLREVEQLETAEICKILDVSANTLGVLLFRARNALRDCMETKGIHGVDDVAM